MKTQLISKFLLFLLFAGTLFSCTRKPSDPSIVRSGKYKESIKEAYQNVGLFNQTNFIPGMAVAVSVGNEVVWADGFGYSNYELKVKSSPTHLYRIGQLTELITTLTAFRLKEEGKLDFDKPVPDYLPQMPRKQNEYTIRQLGAHCAGIRVQRTESGTGNTFSLETLVPSFIDDSLMYEPGSMFSRTELGFDLIGYLIEKSNGTNYIKVVKKMLTDTLKLKATVPDLPSQIIENRCSTYDYNFMAQPIVSSYIDLRGKEASAGYLSSVSDLVRMGNVLLYPGFLKQQTIDELTTPFKLNSGQATQYSFGLVMGKDAQGRRFFGQRGKLTGGCAMLLIYPDDKLVVALAANTGGGSWELPAFEIADIFMKKLHPEMKTQAEETPAN